MMMAERVPPAAGTRRRSRILLVEDEGLIRFTTAEHLRGTGLDVLEARDGDEALLVLRAFAVDLVVTDLNMPGATDGLALARWIDRHRPGLRVLLLSAVPPAADPAIASIVWPAIAKPCRFEMLDDRMAPLLPGG